MILWPLEIDYSANENTIFRKSSIYNRMGKEEREPPPPPHVCCFMMANWLVKSVCLDKSEIRLTLRELSSPMRNRERPCCKIRKGKGTPQHLHTDGERYIICI